MLDRMHLSNMIDRIKFFLTNTETFKIKDFAMLTIIAVIVNNTFAAILLGLFTGYLLWQSSDN